jgi:hypothetical protein
MESKPHNKETKPRFVPEVEQALRDAGWYEGRCLSDEEIARWCAFNRENGAGYYRIFPAALTVLREFGGVFVELDKPGVTCYRNSFLLNPFAAVGLHESLLQKVEWFLGEPLFPLGVTGESQDDILALSNSGKLYCFGIDGSPFLKGNTFDEALHNLIVGIMAQRVGFDDSEKLLREASLVNEAIGQCYENRAALATLNTLHLKTLFSIGPNIEIPYIPHFVFRWYGREHPEILERLKAALAGLTLREEWLLEPRNHWALCILPRKMHILQQDDNVSNRQMTLAQLRADVTFMENALADFRDITVLLEQFDDSPMA